MSDLTQKIQMVIEPEVEAPADKDVGTIDSDIPNVENNYVPLQEYYGIEEPTPDQQKHLSEVWDYFQQESMDRGDVLKAIRDVHNQLVEPEIGQSKLSQLYSYVRINKDIEAAKKEKEAYQKPLEKAEDKK